MFPQGPIQMQLSIHDFTSTFAEPSGSFKGWAEEGFTEPFWRWKRSRASLAAVGGKARVPLTIYICICIYIYVYKYAPFKRSLQCFTTMRL